MKHGNMHIGEFICELAQINILQNKGGSHVSGMVTEMLGNS